MDPTSKKQPTTITAAAGDVVAVAPPPPSDPLFFSTLYKVVKHKARNPAKRYPIQHHSPPSTLSKASDPHRFQPNKSLALSLDAHNTLSSSSSSSLLIKSARQPKKQRPKEEKMDKQRPIAEKYKIKPPPKNVEQKPPEEPKRVSVSLVNGGRRRSFCDAKIELNDFFANVGARVVAVDMAPFMQIHAVSCARKVYDGLEKLSSKTIACTLKKEFDGVYGPAWHCIVGTSFGSFVTHSVGGFLYFSLDHHKLYILLFKTSVQRAD